MRQARRGTTGRLLLLAVGGALVLAACAPNPAAQRPGDGVAIERAKKTLHIATRTESESIVYLAGSGGDAGAQVAWMFHAGLTSYDAQGSLHPRLAQKVPSLTDGDWRANPDGTMEVTWKLRPDVRWHDGTPLTAEDFAFAIEVRKDPNLPVVLGGDSALIADALALDSETLVVRWSKPFAEANVASPQSFPALPRHLLADLYRQGDPVRFMNSSYWSTDFVGVGPYRVGEWQRGSFTEALAFDGYFLGQPRIDRVVIHYILDLNAQVAALLSGDIDMVPTGALKSSDIEPVANAWAPQGGGTVIYTMTQVITARLQFKDPSTPWVNDVRVRQALLHLTDRQTLADTFAGVPNGVGYPDIIVSKADPVYHIAEQRGFATYPYDITRGERLLGDAGWRRGADGIFQNSGGQRFKIDVALANNGPQNVQQGVALHSQWRPWFDSELDSIPLPSANQVELFARTQGALIRNDDLLPNYDRWSSTQIASEQTSWRGQNQSAYSNPEFDRRYAEFVSTLDLSRRQSLHADFLRWMADEVFFLPLFYGVGSSVTAFRRGIRGPTPIPMGQRISTWNIHEWEMD